MPRGISSTATTARSTGSERWSASAHKRIAVIGTGGSIATLGRSSLDLVDYGEFGHVISIASLFDRFPELNGLATFEMTDFRAVHSEAIGPIEWRDLAEATERLISTDNPDGIVIVHGTSTLEETAWFLDRTIGGKAPIVVVGSLRPANAISTDAGFNLACAIRVASQPGTADLGVVAVLNGEIYAARDVTKTGTFGLNAFRGGELGPLGYVDPDGDVVLYRHGSRVGARFNLSALSSLPRVDVVFAYAGADGVCVDALMDAGACGIVVAGMSPGTCGPLQLAALERAAQNGIVAFSSRAGNARVIGGEIIGSRRFIAADNLTPQKARILLMLSLGAADDFQQTQARFDNS
jgi:L-asparaginase